MKMGPGHWVAAHQVPARMCGVCACSVSVAGDDRTTKAAEAVVNSCRGKVDVLVGPKFEVSA